MMQRNSYVPSDANKCDRETLPIGTRTSSINCAQWLQAELPLLQLGLTASSLVKEVGVSRNRQHPHFSQAGGCGPLQLDDRVELQLFKQRAGDPFSEKLDVATFLAGGKPLQRRDRTSAIHKKLFDSLLSDPARTARIGAASQTLVGAPRAG